MANENRVWILKERPDPEITDQTLSFESRPIPEPADGEVLVRNTMLSLDPANRGWMNEQATYVPPVAIGDVMRGVTVGRVVKSRSDVLKEGDWVQGMGGYADYGVAPAKSWNPIPDFIDPPLALGVLGHIGLTAYFGLLDVGQPKPGETVLVSAAAGATGSLVCQIAKLKECRVVGIAGGREKCEWLERELGVDAAIDYKNTDSLIKAVARACPKGVDVFFDNVGGSTLDAALANLALRGRIVLCGMISQYNLKVPDGPKHLISLVTHRGKMEGFIVLDYLERFPVALMEMIPWVQSGQLRLRLDIVDGLEHASRALRKLFAGENQGKLLVKIAS